MPEHYHTESSQNQPSQPTIVEKFWTNVFRMTYKPFARVIDKPSWVETIQAPPEAFVFSSPYIMPYTGTMRVKHPATTRDVSWGEAGLKVARAMTALENLGVKPGDRVAVMSWTSPDWLYVDLAIMSLSAVSVHIYTSTSAQQVDYILKNSGAKVFCADIKHLDKAADTKTIAVDIQSVVYGVPSEADRKQIAKKLAKFDTIHDLKSKKVQKGLTPKQAFSGISGSTIATLIYTSGSTGNPKGAMLTHEAIAASCIGLSEHGFTLNPNSLFLSVLPPAHVFGRVNGHYLCIWNAVPCAFAKHNEISEAFKLYKPTIFLCVPDAYRAIFEKIVGSGFKSKIVNALARYFPKYLAKKVRAGLGGRLEVMMSGGAPISSEVQMFFDRLGISLLQGYGLTETTGGVVSCSDKDKKIGSVGKPIHGAMVRVVDPESGLVVAPETSGEIQISGPMIFAGYWDNKEATSNCFVSDTNGRVWFKTGDRGYITADGYVVVLGRLGREFKLSTGKWISPESIDSAFKAYQGESIVSYAVALGAGQASVRALIFVNHSAAINHLEKAGVEIPAESLSEFLAENQQIKERVERAVNWANENSLEKWERISAYIIMNVEATEENGILTPTRKIKLEAVLLRYPDLVQKLN